MADEFGGEIPIARFARIGDDDIGVAVVSTLRGHRSPAVLLRNHGVFAIGNTAADAVKAAVMCEDAARTVHVARQLGEPTAIDAADVDLLYARYQHAYGQRAKPSGELDELVRAPPDLVPDREPAPLRRRHAAPGGGPVGASRR